MPDVTLKVGETKTFNANPQDAGNNNGAAVFNGPNYAAQAGGFVSVTPAPGVSAPSFSVTGVSPGVVPINITGQKINNFGPVVTTPFIVQVITGDLDHFAPSLVP